MVSVKINFGRAIENFEQAISAHAALLERAFHRPLKPPFSWFAWVIARAGADLSNDFKSIILETGDGKMSPFMRFFWEELQKYIQSCYISPHEPWYWCYIPDSQFIWFRQMFYLLHFWWYTVPLMKSAQHTVYTILIKADVLNTCGTMIC